MEMESLENVGEIRGCQPISTKNNTLIYRETIIVF